MKVPFLSFEATNRQVKAGMLSAYEQLIDSGWYVLGERVKQFEEQYAGFSHTKHCIGVGNGLDALHIALKTLGIGPGDEVIVPSNTYIATLLAVSYTGAMPVLAEPDIHTFNISPSRFAEKINSRTKAVMPVHLYGQACEMTAIMQIADKHGIFVIEDNAQAHGASCDGRLTGSFGHINATSFYPGKNLGALGDAGALTTDNDELATLARMWRNYGSEKKYYNTVKGLNSRLDESQAGVLSVKLPFLKAWNGERASIADHYNQHLQGTGDLILPQLARGCTSAYHLYVIRTEHRNPLQEHLTQQGIGTLIHYPIPPHLQQAYKDWGYKQGDFPIAEKMAGTCLSLPLFVGMTRDQQDYVIETIHNYYKSH